MRTRNDPRTNSHISIDRVFSWKLSGSVLHCLYVLNSGESVICFTDNSSLLGTVNSLHNRTASLSWYRAVCMADCWILRPSLLRRNFVHLLEHWSYIRSSFDEFHLRLLFRYVSRATCLMDCVSTCYSDSWVMHKIYLCDGVRYSSKPELPTRVFIFRNSHVVTLHHFAIDPVLTSTPQFSITFSASTVSLRN